MESDQDKIPSMENQVKAVLLIKSLKELDAELSVLELMSKFGSETILIVIEEICDDELRQPR